MTALTALAIPRGRSSGCGGSSGTRGRSFFSLGMAGGLMIGCVYHGVIYPRGTLRSIRTACNAIVDPRISSKTAEPSALPSRRFHHFHLGRVNIHLISASLQSPPSSQPFQLLGGRQHSDSTVTSIRFDRSEVYAGMKHQVTLGGAGPLPPLGFFPA